MGDMLKLTRGPVEVSLRHAVHRTAL